MSDDSNSSVCKNIKETEDLIKNVLMRIECIEKELRTTHLVDDEREKLEKELADVKKIVIDNEQKLKGLHSKNRQSFMIAVLIMFVGFLLFGLYSMNENRSSN
ncbi:hypothetical protein LSTR_LSTR002087 [Laodelphax striatellus]|uniref:Coiled-coil domain-containing protein 167 n=1 Tax=Laodelphax striatellus TaxID=195883 RepID=A0A482XSV7_LAOST|nr:hypothetical protein LSTR_LSTR002087 [Laodelphax striatellus]